MIDTNNFIKPFLRWAGGKAWLIKHLHATFPNFNYRNYHEPFLGGGAVFFNLNPPNESYLSDLNEELIETYSTIAEDVENVIQDISEFNNTKEDYYKIRSSKFRKLSRRAARFIYLNQTSFNGIYRVNLKGVYNVPYGGRSTQIYDEDNLRELSSRLNRSTIRVDDFGGVVQNLAAGDLVFLDPPYTINHNNNGFIKYNQKLFSLEDQYRLSSLIDEIKEAEAYYILTNAAHKTIDQIFNKGDSKFLLTRPSLIGGANAQRGHYEEFLFTNIEI